MPILQQLTTEAAGVLRTIRLRALREDPAAFGSTYAEESQLTDADWLKRAESCCTERCVAYLAFDQGLPCGVVRGHLDETHRTRAHVTSMWVAPEYRRTGTGSELINAVRIWAEGRGVHELQLMVTNNNLGTIVFYERLGFSMTGITKPYPNDPALFEYEMRKTLNPG